MKKYEKEVLQAFLDEEKRVLAELEDNYAIALHDINLRLENLLARNDADLPHVIYQIEYQKALKTQVQAILEQLQVNEFETISEYLTRCYNTGFIGSMYSFHKQGLPFLIPIDQKQVVDAIRHKTKLKKKLYDELGVDIKKLQKTIAEEISRGISTGLGYGDIARNISLYSKAPLNRAMTIARTESHRIQCQATSDAQYKAKEKGADVLKQWDSTLDGATRPHHRKLDGQIRELDEPFEVAGMKAMFPGDFGKASEDCNCRCAILQRARWALDESELNELKKRAEYYGLDKSKDFEDFQNKYLKASEKVRDSGQKKNDEDTSQDGRMNEPINAGYSENGIIVHNITQANIDKLKLKPMPGMSGSRLKAFEDVHKRVLDIAMTENASKEVAIMLDKEMNDIATILGTATEIDLNVSGRTKAVYVVHNHPNNSSFSNKDVLWFLKNNNVEYFSVVKNNGMVETLVKTQTFDEKVLAIEYRRLVKKYQKDIEDNEQKGYNKVIEKLLQKTKSGLIYER